MIVLIYSVNGQLLGLYVLHEMKLYTKLKTRLQILITISGRVAVTASYSDTFYITV